MHNISLRFPIFSSQTALMPAFGFCPLVKSSRVGKTQDWFLERSRWILQEAITRGQTYGTLSKKGVGGTIFTQISEQLAQFRQVYRVSPAAESSRWTGAWNIWQWTGGSAGAHIPPLPPRDRTPGPRQPPPGRDTPGSSPLLPAGILLPVTCRGCFSCAACPLRRWLGRERPRRRSGRAVNH